MEDHDDADESALETAYISQARRFAASAVLMLEHPRIAAIGSAGLYETALKQAKMLLDLIQKCEACSGDEEFDVLLKLVCWHADALAETFSLLKIS